MSTAFSPSNPRAWWGGFSPQEGQIHALKIGPSAFWVTRYTQEWRVAHVQYEDNPSSVVALESDVAASSIPGDVSVSQFGFHKSPQSLTFSPLMADRAMVVKPEHPFFIQSGEEVTIYVTIPLWLRLSIPETKAVLKDYALYRPTDTWFGSSTIEGELCYASRIKGRLRLEDVTILPHQALTPLRIHNKAKEPLLLEKVKLPVMYLAIYQSDNLLWTQSLSLIREESGDLAALRLGKAAPREIAKAERLAEPRQKAEKNLVVRAFSKLFSMN